MQQASAAPDSEQLRSCPRTGGYVEGRNVAIEYRWADNHYDRLPALAADLVHRHVSVIATTGGSLRFVKAATALIPIVFNTAGDPVVDGTVASLSRPGGNITGATSLNIELGPKQLQLLQELLPKATVVAALINPSSPNVENWSKNVQAAARTLGLQIHVLKADTEQDIDTVFATLLQLRADGIVMPTTPLFTGRVAQLATLTIRHAVPAIYGYSEFARAGGLMSYGASIAESYRLVGAYVGRVLKGEKPSDLPVQQATKVELIVNLRTAKGVRHYIPALAARSRRRGDRIMRRREFITLLGSAAVGRTCLRRACCGRLRVPLGELPRPRRACDRGRFFASSL